VTGFLNDGTFLFQLKLDTFDTPGFQKALKEKDMVTVNAIMRGAKILVGNGPSDAIAELQLASLRKIEQGLPHIFPTH
jgi:hypothetical protein